MRKFEWNISEIERHRDFADDELKQRLKDIDRSGKFASGAMVVMAIAVWMFAPDKMWAWIVLAAGWLFVAINPRLERIEARAIHAAAMASLALAAARLTAPR